MVDNIIAFKAMTQNMTADDGFLPKKSALNWYGSKREKYGPDCWGVSLFYKLLLRGIKPQTKYDWLKSYYPRFEMLLIGMSPKEKFVGYITKNDWFGLVWLQEGKYCPFMTAMECFGHLNDCLEDYMINPKYIWLKSSD